MWAAQYVANGSPQYQWMHQPDKRLDKYWTIRVQLPHIHVLLLKINVVSQTDSLDLMPTPGLGDDKRKRGKCRFIKNYLFTVAINDLITHHKYIFWTMCSHRTSWWNANCLELSHVAKGNFCVSMSVKWNNLYNHFSVCQGWSSLAATLTPNFSQHWMNSTELITRTFVCTF